MKLLKNKWEVHMMYENSSILQIVTQLSAQPNKDCYYVINTKSRNKYLLKNILKKDFTDLTLKTFVQRIKNIETNFVSANIVKHKNIIQNSDFLILIRTLYNNKLEVFSNNELLSYFSDNGYDKVLLTICKVIKEFHSNIYCHGGIKLSNIFYDDENDEYMICDDSFKMINDKNMNLNSKTINFVTPEELEGKEIGIAIDIWQFGVLIYKIAGGKYPFECKTIIESIQKILAVEYSKDELKNNMSFNMLIQKMIRKEPNDRMSIENIEKELNMIYSSECYFVNGFKHELIKISNSGKTISRVVVNKDNNNNAKLSGYSHCYLNIKMDSFVHHFIYQVNGYGNFVFGASLNNKYEGNELCYNNDSCCIRIGLEDSRLFGYNGKKMKECDFKEIKFVNGCVYEVIFNMNDCYMSIKKDKEKEVVLFNHIKKPLYSFVCLKNNKDSANLLKYYYE